MPYATIKQETIYGEPNTMITFDLSGIESRMPKSLRFLKAYIPKGAKIGHMLLLNSNRKTYIGDPMTLSHLTLNDIERSKDTQISKHYISQISRVRPYDSIKN